MKRLLLAFCALVMVVTGTTVVVSHSGSPASNTTMPGEHHPDCDKLHRGPNCPVGLLPPPPSPTLEVAAADMKEPLAIGLEMAAADMTVPLAIGTAFAFSAPTHVELTLRIPNEKVDNIRAGFLHLYPVPLDEEGAPTMSDLAWVRERIRKWVLVQATIGLQKKARDEAVAPDVDDGDIQ